MDSDPLLMTHRHDLLLNKMADVLLQVPEADVLRGRMTVNLHNWEPLGWAIRALVHSLDTGLDYYRFDMARSRSE